MQTILKLYEKSSAAEFGFTLAEFAELLTDVARRSLGEGFSPRAESGLLETLRMEELVLARACARGNQSAWERLVVLYRENLYRAASAITRDDCTGHELADSLYADLFGTSLGKNGCRNSKLESYLGRGSLEGWLKAVLAQQYVNRLRQEKRLVAFDDELDSSSEAYRATETASGKALLANATDAVLARLSADERLLLAAYYLDGRTLAGIARMLKVHESTISRRLEKLIESLRKQILARLRAAGLSKREAGEMLDSDVRELKVNVRDRLAQGKQA